MPSTITQRSAFERRTVFGYAGSGAGKPIRKLVELTP
jgi:hypothetical protein